MNVTPRTRAESIIRAVGLLVEATGWFTVLGAGIQAFGAVVTIALALNLIWLGRKVRSR